MQTHDILSVPSRRAVFECVREHAGTHLREVARRSEMPLGTTLYHLDCLEAADLIVARRDGRYKRYFPSHDLGRREKEVLSFLRHDAPRRILRALLEMGPSTQRGLCRALGLSRSTMSFHLNRLVAEDLVAREVARPENRYRVAEPDLVRELLARFADSLAPPRRVPLVAAPPATPDAEAAV